MAFRNVVIHSRSKLESSLNYLICRKGDTTTKILLDEIRVIIIDSIQVSITTNLISECLKKKIKIVFTDEVHNPIGEAVPYQNNYYSYRHLKEQIDFSNDSKDYLWQQIIKRKIINQEKNLRFLNLIQQADKLNEYSNEVKLGDITNREGHSAKVYFNALFGKGFSRDDESRSENKYLNYGYSIILSIINKEIKALGYFTELGIHHKGESNSFNLSCDLMEPLRPLIDLMIISNKIDENNYKLRFIELLSSNVSFLGKNILLENSIHLYVENLLSFLKTGQVEKIEFIEYGL